MQLDEGHAMKAKLLGTASAAVIALASMAGIGAHAADVTDPTIAYPQTFVPEQVWAAQIGLWGGAFVPHYLHEEGDTGDFKTNAFGFGGEARGIYEFSPGRALQMELQAVAHTNTDDDGGTSDKSGALHVAAGGHLIHRDERRAWGVFGGLTGEKFAEEPETGMSTFLGAEYAHFMDATTLYIQGGGLLGFWAGGGGAEPWAQGVFGRVGARHFFTPNSKLEGSIAGGVGSTIDADESSDKDPLAWFQGALEYEHKISDGPLSLFAGYKADYVRVDEAGGCCWESVWMHAVKVGVRMSLGQDTLFAQDRRGAATFTFVDLSAPLMYADELD
jgi:hypothetical protein